MTRFRTRERVPAEQPVVLSAEQAAYVIKWMHYVENEEPRRNNWKDKVPLGLSAVHATWSRHSAIPELDGKRPPAMLTSKEMDLGLKHIKNEDDDSQPTTHEQDEYIADLVEKRGISYDEARRSAGQ